LKQFEKLNSRIIEIDQLKQMIGVNLNEYQLYGDFKRRIIIKAKEEINLKTDIMFEFEEVKGYRNKVTAIRFFITSKVQRTKLKEANQEQEIVIKPQVQEIIMDFQRLYNGILIESFVQKMIEEKGIDHVKECLKTYKEHTDGRAIHNIAGDFFTYVTKGYKRPVKKVNKPKYADFNQREYTEEEYERFYANLKPEEY
jgi:plasmid replication initiation protein